MTVTTRPATTEDVADILWLTNQAINETTAIWVSTPMTLEQRLSWFEQRQRDGFPVIIAEENGKTLGFASYGAFRPYEGYVHTVEHSVYVHPESQGKGVGRALLDTLIAEAQRAGLHVMVAAITADNAASIALHERCGFEHAGVMPEVGTKFGGWLDLLFMYRRLSTP
ncbi:N-acetyltransferase [Acetobacter sacchari]|uniref:N-acetyltransferase n=1 Tax=Acetobacter sacchari TaxID=2661687 RepID=A0ABS3M0N2_9PROT|nr:GNAT family N-acetyltransferase [Acetobacter sacchari]MBO1361666.1 N-acetyltransferase [Acetobacter sacchari]